MRSASARAVHSDNILDVGCTSRLKWAAGAGKTAALQEAKAHDEKCARRGYHCFPSEAVYTQGRTGPVF
jgi:hypothetical protein